VGGLAMGDAFTSFDKSAFASFGLEQGANAAMSEGMAKTYVVALNDLIRKRSRKLAGVRIAYWFDRPAEEEVVRIGNPFEELFGMDGAAENEDAAEEDEQSPEDKNERMAEIGRARTQERAAAEGSVKRLLDAIRSGERPELAKANYYALILSANSGRVVVRDWMEGRFKDLLEAIHAWFDDLKIVNCRGDAIIERFKLYSLMAAAVRDAKDAPVWLQNALLRSAIKKQPIPRPIVAQTLRRIHLDAIQGESPRYVRYALLKSFCIRNERIDMTPELNELETNPAYLCGRIIAIFSHIQEVAIDPKAGVVQRYYAAASSIPALVLGRMVRMAIVAHLPKIQNEGLRIWFERQLTETWGKLKSQLPPTFSLEEQTLVAMGFYHQNARRFSKNDKKEEATATV
jgi:CRISPR-associated protein Csd1